MSRIGFRFGPVWFLLLVVALLLLHVAAAWAVTPSVDVGNVLAVLPEYGMGVHTSVYDGGLGYEASPAYPLLNDALDGAGVNVLRYPGGGYADVFHFSTSRGE